MLKKCFKIFLCFSTPIFINGCKKVPHAPTVYDALSNVDKGVAVVSSIKGGKISGIANFEPTGNGLKVTATIERLKSNAKHGFHIHEFGNCTAADLSSAGGHYNPEGKEHAGPENIDRHAGDMGNLVSNEKGSATYEYTFSNLTVAGGMNPVIGRSVIVHENEDNLVSQPTGNAGSRVACGVIGIGQ